MLFPVEYTYDAQGRMQTMKTWANFASGLGAAITTWKYDPARGWLDSKDYPDATSGNPPTTPGTTGPTYTYTPGGRLQTRVWKRGLTTAYSYDNAGLLSAIGYSDATPGVTHTYDRRGRQRTISAGGMTTTLSYNDANQLLSESHSGGTLHGLAVTNGYDARLRRSAVGLNTQPATLTQYGYDSASRLQSVTNGSSRATYTYLANSLLVGQIGFTNNGVRRMTATKQYDFLNRLTAISSAPSASSVVSFGYSYNSANQRTRNTTADGSYWLYEYDSLGQVKSGKKYFSDGYPVPGQQFEYAHDDIGNRKTTASGGDENGANLRSATYTPNNLNQYTSRTVPGAFDVLGLAMGNNSTLTVNSAAPWRKGEYFRRELSAANSAAAVWQSVSVAATGETSVSGNVFVPQTPEAFYYDLDGNLTNDGRWTYTWDAENRLVSLTSASSAPTGSKLKLDFTYDWKGRRVEKLVSTNNGSSYVAQYTNRFVYDGWNLMAVLAPNLSVIRSFLWGLDLSGSLQGAGGVGGLLVVNDAANGAHFCAYDGNGNVAALVKATDGTVSANCEYGPFGEVLRLTGLMAKANPFRFSTKYQDDETDLLYYGYRSYNSSTGRWLNRDPIGEWGGLNLYAFVQNDPVAYWDRLGLAKKKCGVESFVVKWVGLGDIPSSELARNPGALLKIHVKITFKNGGDFDARCCEYKQNSSVKFKLTRDSQIIAQGDLPMEDDGYSRSDDVDGNKDDPNFETNDFPGLKGIREGDVLDYSFTAEQIVYSPGKSFAANKDKKVDACDCEKNDKVAKRGPHTASVTGIYSKKLKYNGVPKELK